MNFAKAAAVIILGAILGAIFGVITRPDILGMPVPLGVLTSSAPMDAPFRSELISHLMLCIVGSTLIAGLTVAGLSMLTRSRLTRS